MREELLALVKDIGLTTVGLGVAFGYALFNFAGGVAQLVDGLLTHASSTDGPGSGPGLTWDVGHRVVTLDALLVGAIELIVVLAAAYYVRRAGRSR